MAPFKIMISAVALTAFTATGTFAQDRHRERQNPQQRTQQAEQARPREQAQPRQPQAQRQEQPRREAEQPRREEVQPRAYQPQRAPQVQPRTFEQRGQQVQPRTYDRRDTQVRPDYRNYSGDRAVPRTYETQRPYRYDSRDRDDHRYYNGRTFAYVSPRIIRPYFDTFEVYRPYVYRPSWRIGVYYGSDGYYPYGYTPDYYFNPIPGHLYGGLRIVNAPRDAQVFADGYYVGIVNDFDGIFQHLNLEAGPHHIEINEPGLQPVAFDVNIAPGRTITFRADPYMFQP